MPPVDPLEPLPPPLSSPPVIASAVRCVSCGYDLSGTAIGGTCSECGAEVARSLRPAGAAVRTSGFAIASFVCGILAVMLAACAPMGLVGIVAIGLYFPAMKEVNSGSVGGSSKGFAIAGLVMGIIGAVLGATCLGFVLIAEMV
jgi:hypothetical protein